MSYAGYHEVCEYFENEASPEEKIVFDFMEQFNLGWDGDQYYAIFSDLVDRVLRSYTSRNNLPYKSSWRRIGD